MSQDQAIHIFSDYQRLVLAVMGLMNLVCALMLWFVCYALIRFPTFRAGLTEAIQNGDKVFHWIDAKSFGYFIAGWLCAWFTMNITGVFIFAKMFDFGPLGFVSLFVGVTFTLWGFAWKK